MRWFVACALLLAIERLAYIWIWRHPATFRARCAHPSVAWTGGPVAMLRVLFVGFKALQIGVFAAWCYRFGDGRLWPEAIGAEHTVPGIALMVVGQTLTLSAFARLGTVGVFYGNRFGYSVPVCRHFPYSVFAHPQYVGAVLTIWGVFLIMRFPAPDWFVLPALETAYYVAGGYFEQ
jgi:phosphatidyl-N-methylethanolamine N-methyltransferase